MPCLQTRTWHQMDCTGCRMASTLGAMSNIGIPDKCKTTDNASDYTTIIIEISMIRPYGENLIGLLKD